MRFLILGPPGAGKATQSKQLADHYQLPLLSTVGVLHDAVSRATDAGGQAKAYLDLGQHVPDEILFDALHERMTHKDIQRGFVLVGFPRTTSQAELLDAILYEVRQPLDLALVLELSDDMVMERLEGLRTCLSCGCRYNVYTNPSMVDRVCDECGGRLRHRAENNEETLANRLRVYEQQMEALAQYYEANISSMHCMSGDGSVDAIKKGLCKLIDAAPPVVIDAVEAAIKDAVTKVTSAKKRSPVKKKRVTKKKIAAKKKVLAKKKVPVKKRVATKKKGTTKKQSKR